MHVRIYENTIYIYIYIWKHYLQHIYWITEIGKYLQDSRTWTISGRLYISARFAHMNGLWNNIFKFKHKMNKINKLEGLPFYFYVIIFKKIKIPSSDTNMHSHAHTLMTQMHTHIHTNAHTYRQERAYMMGIRMSMGVEIKVRWAWGWR